MRDKRLYLNVLSKYLGDYIPKKDDNYAFQCPFCNHHKKKLEVDLQSGLWSCWVCRTSGIKISNLLKKVHANTFDINHFLSSENYGKKVLNYSSGSHLSLPDNYIKLEDCGKSIFTDRLKNYLYGRGLNDDDIIKYKVGYLDGNSINTVVVPSYDKDFNLNFYVKKNIVTGRYNNPDFSKNQIIFESFVSWQNDVVLTEGVFDAMAIKRNVIPLLGKTLNPKLKSMIIESPSQNFYIALDGGEIKDILKIAKFIMSCGKNAYYINIPVGDDASSLGHKKVWEHINSATQITQDDIFMYDIKSRLYTL
jgi:hypothetical protein